MVIRKKKSTKTKAGIGNTRLKSVLNEERGVGSENFLGAGGKDKSSWEGGNSP